MAGTPEDPNEARLDRLEVQMQAVLASLERLNESMAPATERRPVVEAPPPAPQPPPTLPPAPAMPMPPQPSRFYFDTPPPPVEPGTAQPPTSAASAPETARPTSAAPSIPEAPPRQGEGPVPPPRITVPPPPRPAASNPAFSAPQIDWEDLVGRRWALWVGAVAVFLSVAFFLASAWASLSPAGRLAVGGCAGLALLFGAEFARSRTMTGFSEGLAGAGLAVLYLDAWAASARYGLAPFNTALVLMVVVAAVGVIFALRYESTSLHALATLGGFLTPVLLKGSGAGGSILPFLAYVTVLNAGVLSVAVAKSWRGNVAFAALATIVLFTGWALDGAWASQPWTAFTFLTVNFLFYTVALLYPAVARHEATESSDWVLLLAASAFYFAGGFAFTQEALGAAPGAFPVGLAALFATCALLVRLQSPKDEPLWATCVAIACTAGVLAVPIQLRQGWVSVGWSAEAAALLTLAGITGSMVLRRAGQVVWVLAGVAVLSAITGPVLSTHVLFNNHGIPVLGFSLATLWLATFLKGRDSDELRPAYAAAWVWALAWLIGQEISFAFHIGLLTLPARWTGGEPFIVAMVLAVYALCVYAITMQTRDREAGAACLAVIGIGGALTLGASAMGEGANWLPIWNPRFVCYVMQVLSLLAIAWMAGSAPDEEAPEQSAVARFILPVVHVLVMVCIGLELFASYAAGGAPGWEAAAAMAIATFLCCYAALMLLPAFNPDRYEIRWIAWLAAGCGALVLLANASASWAYEFTPIVNARFADFLICVVALVTVAVLSARFAEDEGLPMAGIATGVAALVALWGVTQETYFLFAFYREAFGDYWQTWAQSGISTVWSVIGIGMLMYGITRKQRLVRLTALGLFSVTVLKVFLFDLGFLENASRVLSFGGLGLALIGISWLYSRFGMESDPEAAAPGPEKEVLAHRG